MTAYRSHVSSTVSSLNITNSFNWRRKWQSLQQTYLTGKPVFIWPPHYHPSMCGMCVFFCGIIFKRGSVNITVYVECWKHSCNSGCQQYVFLSKEVCVIRYISFISLVEHKSRCEDWFLHFSNLQAKVLQFCHPR